MFDKMVLLEVIKPMKIEMIQRRFGYFPLYFSISGKKHRVTSVSRCATTGTKKELKRHYFEVICDDGKFNLYQNLDNNTWHVVNRFPTRSDRKPKKY